MFVFLGRFVDVLKDRTPEKRRQVAILLKYYAYLHYTGITHPSFSSIYPYRSASPHHKLPTISQALKTFSTQLRETLLQPRLWFFLPPFLLHLPGYIIGNLSARYLVDRTLEETQAGTIAICGGLTYGLTAGWTTWKLYDLLLKYLANFITGSSANLLSSIQASSWGTSLYRIGLAFSVYAFTRIVFRWHNKLIDSTSGNPTCLLGTS